MISSLYIKNVAVVKELSIDLSEGFSVLTGETGSGKSVIMDCIGILIGARSAKGKIRNGESEAVIRGCFCNIAPSVLSLLSDYGYECDGDIILQRTISADGRGSVRLNGQTVTQSLAKEIGSYLIDMHGQNDNQRLLRRSEHLGILDTYADLGVQREEYRLRYAEYKDMKARVEDLRSMAREKARLIDVYRFQAAEIDDVSPRVGEEEKLSAEEKRLENLEKIRKHTSFTYHALKSSERSALALVDKASASVSHLEGIIPDADAVNDRLMQIRYELEDIADAVSAWDVDDGENAEKKLDKIGSRLVAIERLKKKYGGSVEEILDFRRELGERLDEMENSDALIEESEKRLAELERAMLDKARVLSELRRSAALKLQGEIMRELEFLEMPKVRFVVDIGHLQEPNATGADDVEFLISANAGQAPMPMIKIASGGELSRIMLAIKSILLDQDGVGTVIFDEIDTGISGKTSRKVGIKLKRISEYTQVICVTHSAQIASLATSHYLISKSEVDGAVRTAVSLIEDEDRVSEIARILGGLSVTDAQILAAREMIEEGTGL